MNKRKILAFLRLTISLTLIFAFVVGGIWSFFHIKYTSTQNDRSKVSDSYVNALLLGVDADGIRTDVIIFAQLDMISNSINMMQIPRDTYVAINKLDKKINSAYVYNKEKELFKEVEYILGEKVDKYILVDTSGFRDVIDAIGGIDFNVPINMKYYDPVQDFRIDLNKGQQHLNGKKAEMFVRFRQNDDGSGYPLGDIQRLEAQRSFINAVISKIFNAKTLFAVPKLADIVTDCTKTNFTTSEIFKYIPKILNVDRSDFNIMSLPGEGKYIGLTSYFVHDEDQLKEMLDIYFTPFSDSADELQIKLRDKVLKENNGDVVKIKDEELTSKASLFSKFTKINIIDGSKGNAKIDRIVETIQDMGYKVNEIIDNGDVVYTDSYVFAKKENKNAANIADAFGMDNYIVNEDIVKKAAITIIIGKNFK